MNYARLNFQEKSVAVINCFFPTQSYSKEGICQVLLYYSVEMLTELTEQEGNLRKLFQLTQSRKLWQFSISELSFIQLLYRIWNFRSRLKMYITFGITPANRKISLLLFVFAHTKYIYLKRRTNFLSNHDTHKK